MMFDKSLSTIIITLLIWNSVSASKNWNGWSPNDNNDRYQRDKLPVTLPTTKTEFKQLWCAKLDSAVGSSPTVYECYVYVSSFGGNFYCLHADTGIVLWQKNLSSIINNGRLYSSRTGPLVYNNLIILGLSDVNVPQEAAGSGSYAVAFNRFTGACVWQRQVSSHPSSLITSTPQLANDRLFIGISSVEEAVAANPAYPCCTFQGSVVALKASTGQCLWERKMIPDNNGQTTGYSGAGVWGSQFPVDYKRNQIYVATANLYKLPASVERCLTETRNLTLFSDPCREPGVYGLAVLALDMNTGLVRWSQNIGPTNAWTVACVVPSPVPNPNCPPNPGFGYDFGQAPIFKMNLKYKFGGANRDQLFVAQKSGKAFGFDAETGTITWCNQVAPGSNTGGMVFGSAADDQNIYVGNNNADGLRYTLPNGATTTKASWSALDLVSGEIKWTTVDPTTNINQTSAYRALTVWDQLVLVQGGSQLLDITPRNCLYGLNKKNGKVLYEKCIDNTLVDTGASVARNTIYVGTGIPTRRGETDGLIALQLPPTY